MMPPPPNTFVSMGATINKEPLSPPGPESSVDTDDISPGVWVCGGYNQPGTHGSTKVVIAKPCPRSGGPGMGERKDNSSVPSL